MALTPTLLVINLENQTQGSNDFDDVELTQPLGNSTPTSSINKVEKRAKRDKMDVEIMWNVAFELGRTANVLEADKSQFFGKELFDEIIILCDCYFEYDLGQAYDYLLQNLPLATGFINKTRSII